jgi:hypothetical protein
VTVKGRLRTKRILSVFLEREEVEEEVEEKMS